MKTLYGSVGGVPGDAGGPSDPGGFSFSGGFLTSAAAAAEPRDSTCLEPQDCTQRREISI